MLKKLRRNKKGFTLAELLIVVAIIGVLVAISIPIFTSQLEKARDAVTLSNLRAAYAEAQTAYLTEDTTSSEAKYIPATAPGNGNQPAKVIVYNVESKGQKAGLDNISQLPFGDLVKSGTNDFTAAGSLGGKAQKWDITFTYDADGKITSVSAAAHKNS